MLDFPATHRNREVIAQVLSRCFEPEKELSLLEVASGSGQHITYFAQQFPNWSFQPTDIEIEHLQSVSAYAEYHGVENVLVPRHLNVAGHDLKAEEHFDGILAINLIHISPWACTVGLFDMAQSHLKEGGRLFLYGAYRRGGAHTAPSNESFDRSLRERNPEWGVRCLDEVAKEALEKGFVLRDVVEMPANNLSVLFSREQ